MDLVKIRRAIISVSDKSGVVEFAKKLAGFGVEIISTGGTLSALHEAGIPAKSISEVTNFPEILDGRVKTLHPAVHAGLLGITENPAHEKQMRELNLQPIEMVVVNLYPFEKTIAQDNTPLDEAVEQIDIGGPSMIRSCAKNFREKTVVIDPSQYAGVISELERTGGSISAGTRFAFAKKAFARTAQYDSVIAAYLTDGQETAAGKMPQQFSVNVAKSEELRYGENPHQHAAIYGEFDSFFEKLHGKELSFNNIADIQAAAELAEEFSEPTCVIVKHSNPCGVGSAKSLAEAYRNAFATDPKSAFGGIVCVNRPLDIDTAKQIDAIFTEVVVAPDFPADVLELLKKKKDRRLVRQRKTVSGSQKWNVRSIAGGYLVQSPDRVTDEFAHLKVVTKRKPTEAEMPSLKFAWRVAKHVKSNAIVYAQAGRTVGIGAGQMSRFDSSRVAAQKAKEFNLPLEGAAVASDAFFPFADGLLEAVNVGATAVIQPGGSVRDEEVIRAADEHNVAMVFTGIRHFKH
ncbi:MAG TPA: bifunctional phosphoribosylaminoimidazolecarboxamide formyltransferase/IMP cyclohydrolase [Bacteroidota bacterium]|nr:bifunctional phosphoribosylaminoimidazolecarboxamide formyltransferase/IMP cyclohydrolase [Bacteroidota bacterium]